MITYNDGTTAHSANLERARTDVRAIGKLAALNAELLLSLNGESSASFDIRGTFVGTVVVEGSDDGTNFISIPFYNSVTEVWATTATSAGTFDIPAISSLRIIRVRCSAFTSGSVITSLNASLGISMVYSKPIPTTTTGTVTAATGVSATLTLPAPGAGLYHYITRLVIERHISGLLTAGATPIIVTSTNITGSLAFSIPADAAPAGQVYREVIEMGEHALKSTTANTATTIVAPVVTGVIWRITAYYYVGA
jgi:hypothetical protein